MDQLGENAAEQARIELDEDGGRFVLHFNARRLELRFGAQVGDQIENKSVVIGGFDFHVRRSAFRENQDVADQVADAFDLLADAGLGLGARFRADVGPVKRLGGEADDAKRVFQVVDDGTGEIADHGQAFGLDDFTEVKMVEFAEAVADMLQQAERQRGRALDERKHFAARKEINVRVLDRGGGGRARAMLDDGHFAKNFPGPKPGKDAPAAGTDDAGNFHQPVFDKIDAIAGIVFMENLTAGGKMPFLGDQAQRLQFVAAQIAKQGNGFQRGHQCALYQFWL